jgi:hypothetical protein
MINKTEYIFLLSQIIIFVRSNVTTWLTEEPEAIRVDYGLNEEDKSILLSEIVEIIFLLVSGVLLKYILRKLNKVMTKHGSDSKERTSLIVISCMNSSLIECY